MLRALDLIDASMADPSDGEFLALLATVDPDDVGGLVSALVAITDRLAREMLPGHGKAVLNAVRSETLAGTGGIRDDADQQARHRFGDGSTARSA